MKDGEPHLKGADCVVLKARGIRRQAGELAAKHGDSFKWGFSIGVATVVIFEGARIIKKRITSSRK